MLAAIDAADEPPAAAVGDVVELFDVDVDHRSWVGVFVAAHDLAGADVDVRGLIQPASHGTACTVEAGINWREAIDCGDILRGR